MANFKLQVISPDRIFYEGDVEMVEVRTTEGEMGIYAEHIPLTAIIAPGILRIHENGEVKEMLISFEEDAEKSAQVKKVLEERSNNEFKTVKGYFDKLVSQYVGNSISK